MTLSKKEQEIRRIMREHSVPRKKAEQVQRFNERLRERAKRA